MISKISNWYFSKDALPYWCVFALDCLIVFFSDIFVYALNNGAVTTAQDIVPLSAAFAVYLLFYVVVP